MMPIAINETEIVGVLVAILGSLGAIVISIAQARKAALLEKEMRLKIRDLLVMRDAVLKDALLSQYESSLTPEDISRLNRAFEKVDDVFRTDYLPSVFGTKEAAELDRIIREREIFEP